MSPASPRRHLITLLKLLCGAGLLTYLAWQAQQQDAFQTLVEGKKNWSLLATGLLVSIASVLLSFVRWFLVIRAANIDIRLPESIRVGALGFALNFVGPGGVGGDLFKAILVARGRPGERAAAVSTVIVDRVMGLYSMLLMASGAILAFQSAGIQLAGPIAVTCQTTLIVTAVASLGVALMFVPGIVGPWLNDLAGRIPAVGKLLVDLLTAWKDYQKHKLRLAGALLLSLVIDLLLVLSFVCVAKGLPLESPSFLHHLFIVPLQLIAGAIPLTPGGMGTREAAANLMYQGFGVAGSQGTLVAFGHTLTMMAAAGVAVVYYLLHRSRVQAAIPEA